ncbi:MAG: LamB/YcsF family protein [Bacteroidetes bacterium]|nr:LamB/YcsF family protein [Bacteroidota bacterium]
MPPRNIDINGDMGESLGPWLMGQDELLMPWVTAANIACGMHAGDPGTIQTTIALAAAHQVAIGAHPSYPDLLGFGRRDMALTPDEVYQTVLYQTGALGAMARVAGQRLHHVKPHGALYNKAAVHAPTAVAVVEAVHRLDPGLFLYGPPGSEMERAARSRGLPFCREVFADRRYLPDGRLMPRQQPGAVLASVEMVAAQVEQILRFGSVTCADGSTIPLEGDTVCVHGDGEHAVAFAKAVRHAIEAAGMHITPSPRP